MLNYIWVILLVTGISVGIANGRAAEIGEAIVNAANDAVVFCLGMVGIVAFWCGLIQILQDAGGVDRAARILRPMIRILFPETKHDPEAERQVITNITANFFGLGNGATPSGIAAVRQLQKTAVDLRRVEKKEVASKSVCLFLVINSASVQLIPTTVIALRAAQGARNPADILIPTWIVSVISLLAGILVFKGYSTLRKH